MHRLFTEMFYRPGLRCTLLRPASFWSRVFTRAANEVLAVPLFPRVPCCWATSSRRLSQQLRAKEAALGDQRGAQWPKLLFGLNRGGPGSIVPPQLASLPQDGNMFFF